MRLVETPTFRYESDEGLVRTALLLNSLDRLFPTDVTSGHPDDESPTDRLYNAAQLLVQCDCRHTSDLMDLSPELIDILHEESGALLEESSLQEARAQVLRDIRDLDTPLRRALLDLFELDRIEGADLDALVEARGGFEFASADCYTTGEKRSRAILQIGHEIIGALPQHSALSLSIGMGLELLGGYLEPLPSGKLLQELGRTAYLFRDQAGLSYVGGSYHEGRGRRRGAGPPALLVCPGDPDAPTTRDRSAMASDGCILIHDDNAAIFAAMYCHMLETGAPLVSALIRDLLRKRFESSRISPSNLYRTRLSWVAAHEWGHEINQVATTADFGTDDWWIDVECGYWTGEAHADLAMLDMIWLRTDEAERERIAFWNLINAISVVCDPDVIPVSPYAVSNLLVHAALQTADPVLAMLQYFDRIREVIVAQHRSDEKAYGPAIRDMLLDVPEISKLPRG